MKKLEFLATILTIIGYYCVTNGFMFWGILISLLGSALWIWWAKYHNAIGIIIVNCFLGSAGILGFIKLLG